jgi:hypothetical protein
MANLYRDPVLEKYKALIKANTSAFRYFYQGDPKAIPVSSMPAIIMEREQTRVGAETNVDDRHDMAIRITVVVDVRKDLHESADGIIPGYATLYDLVEGRDSTYSLKSSSLLDILRSNLLIDGTYNLSTDIGTMTQVSYTEGQRGENLWTVEAVIAFTCSAIQLR